MFSRWEHIPYGQLVQIKPQTPDVDHPVGTVGKVLSEEEHGIVRHPGWVSIKPRFPGVHGCHVFVQFGKAEPELCSLSDLAPA